MSDKRVRIDMRIPESILKKIEDYQQDQGITTRTSAILELIRKGLNDDKRI
ncbi:hypothetical protein [Bacillus taeanensis]|uniref:hypothetical protein n=1 Tax=Bacillus taeanensis TaxID=273032 RepID=UPI0015F0530B|nr:hypothetical protein [Bacillus taeanensis]